MANAPRTSDEPESVQVIARFGVRMLVLCIFAALGGNGFGRTLAPLLLLSAALCVAAAAIRRERPFDTALTHWDEAVVCLLLYGMLPMAGQASLS